MKTILLILLSSVLIILASWLTFAHSDRYGIHSSESVPCGKNPTQETFATATVYLLTTQTYEQQNVTIGTCPYQNFAAKTLALELWTPALIFSFMSYRSVSNKRRGH